MLLTPLFPLHLSFIDPTLEHDLNSSTKPWALSPLISTMPHLAHRHVPVSSSLASRSPSPSSSPVIDVIPQPSARDPQSSKSAMIDNTDTWPPFPSLQSLTDDTAQLYLTLRSPVSLHSRSCSHSPSPSPHLSRQPSSSGRATPESSDGPVPTFPIESESFDPGNPGLVLPSSTESPSSTDKNRPTNHEDKREERRDRERTEKPAEHEQELQELRTAYHRRAYFLDALHRQELTFGPEVTLNPISTNDIWSLTLYVCAPLGHLHDRFLLRFSSVRPDTITEPAWRHLV